MEILNRIKFYLFDNKKKIFALTILLLISITVTILFLRKTTYKTEKLVYENKIIEDSLEDEKTIEKETNYYYVDIKGEVKQPGVYKILKGKRVIDVINEAGGITDNAETSILNLSLEVEDAMVIIVYSKDEVKNYTKTIDDLSEKIKICEEEVKNDACIKNNDSNIITNKEKDGEKNNSKEISKDTASNKNLKININTANLEELMNLNKIGEVKAKAIIDYRTKNGSFEKIEDIKNVNGIGEKLFETIKENITV